MKRLASLVLAAALAASPASAQVLLNDHFNGENGGLTYLGYAGFANWAVVGNVDLVKSGDFGITCPSGACVDLDGTTGPGHMFSLQNFGFASGDIMRISFDVSGNQRGGGADVFSMGLNFAGNTQLGAYAGTGGFSSVFGSSLFSSSYTVSTGIADNTPFSTWSFQFQAIDPGAFQLVFGTTSADNVGPLLDNVSVERFSRQTVTPEPSTWAMLAFGLGSVGFVSRRRVRKA
ncbi:MAG: PEP-CTERM sorting domain-containing protein [Gemmatimonadaceae bacterium]